MRHDPETTTADLTSKIVLDVADGPGDGVGLPAKFPFTAWRLKEVVSLLAIGNCERTFKASDRHIAARCRLPEHCFTGYTKTCVIKKNLVRTQTRRKIIKTIFHCLKDYDFN